MSNFPDNKQEGWARIYRSIFKNPLYFIEPFTKAQAWIDLILLANHQDGIIMIRGNIVPVKRGQIAWSRERLADRWKWSRGRVNRFILYLETVQQIEQQKSNILSLITVINYNYYQSERTPDGTTDGTTDGHQTVQQTDTNKNVKNEKNEKKRIRPPHSFRKILDDPETIKKLRERFIGQDVTGEIERMKDYLDAHGKRYKNYTAFARTWLGRIEKGGGWK